MKRISIVFLFTGMSLTALLFGISCSNQTPNSAFVAPLQTVSANNPPWTNTPTFTFTPTPTITPTPIPYPVSGFSTPYALAIDSKNNIYVGDTGNNLIKQFIGGYLNANWPLGKNKTNGLSYPSPKAIAADIAGNLYVVGNGNVVSKYYANGDFAAQYSISISGPQGVAVYGNPATVLYVSNAANQIVSISLPGNTLNANFDPLGTTPGVLPLSFTPYGLAVDSLGNLYVVDSANSKIHIYNSVGTAGATIQGFNAPYAVVLDANNNIYVSDTGNSQIEEFTLGNYAGPSNIIGSGGTLSKPEGIALDSSANVYVVDSIDNELFQFP